MTLPHNPNISPEAISRMYNSVVESFPEGLTLSNITKAVTTLMQMVGRY